MREKIIENIICEHAKKLGWLVYKWKSPANVGVPDRLFIRDGAIVPVEFKRYRERPTKMQLHQHALLVNQGIPVYVIDSVDSGKELFNRLTHGQKLGNDRPGLPE